MKNISKIIHAVWIGDDSKRPDSCLNSWMAMNPSWEFRLWGNKEYRQYEWTNKRHMEQFWPLELNGVCDLMRWEILHHCGGIVVDADSLCVRQLPDWLCECSAVACWEHELIFPGRLATGFIGAIAGNDFIEHIINDIAAEQSLAHKKVWSWRKMKHRCQQAWETVGNQRLTDAFYKYRYRDLTILPSHFFLPEHWKGENYSGDLIFAEQYWGTTKKIYGNLHQITKENQD